jgi:hypothetical protein
MDVVVQYFEGCPHAELATDRVREALRSVGLNDQEIMLQRIDSPEDAAGADFHGSPTILVDGVDPLAGETPSVGYACRVYETGAGREGAPSLAQLAGVLERRSRAS